MMYSFISLKKDDRILQIIFIDIDININTQKAKEFR